MAVRGVPTREGDGIVAIGEIVTPRSAGVGINKDKRIEALVRVDVAVSGIAEGGGPAIAAAAGIGAAVIFEIAVGDGGTGWLKVHLNGGPTGGRRGSGNRNRIFI